MEHLTKKNYGFYKRDIERYYASYVTEQCLKTLGQLLDFCSQNFADAKCILYALALTITSNTCNLMGRNFTKIERSSIDEPESVRVTDIPGAVVSN